MDKTQDQSAILAGMETYHIVWLSVHPERTPEWLKERFRDGFHVHHIDGNHSNDDPLNLVLIESGDHMMLHNGSKRLLWRPPSGKKSPGRPKKAAPPTRSELQGQHAALGSANAKVADKSARRAQARAPKPVPAPRPVPAPSARDVKKQDAARLYEAAASRLRFLDSLKTKAS